jgi:hypothetical protein
MQADSRLCDRESFGAVLRQGVMMLEILRKFEANVDVSIGTSSLAFALSIGALVLVGCSDGGSVSQPAAPPPPPPPVATSLVVNVQPAGARAGIQIATQPVVSVRDNLGQVFTSSRADVTVSIASGTAVLEGTRNVIAVDGIATFTDLMLVGQVGSVTLRFDSPGLTGTSAQAIRLDPGLPRRLVLDTASTPVQPWPAQTMRPLSPQPVVRVVDIAGNPTPFTGAITAEVATGNAVVRAGGSTTADAQGRAAFSDLTLGAKDGNTGLARLRFSGAGVDADTLSVRLGCADRTVELNRTFVGRFQDGDCRFTTGFWLQLFRLTSVGTANAHILESDGSHTTQILVRPPNEPRFYWTFSASEASNRSAHMSLMPAGTTLLSPTFSTVGVEGQYTLRVIPTSTDIRCTRILAGAPLNLQGQRLGEGDCLSGDFWGDFLYFGLPQGATITATVSGASFAPFAAIWRDSPRTSMASAQGQNAATVTYTNTTDRDSFHYLYIGTVSPNATGTYNLEFRISYPQASGLLTEGTGLSQPQPIIGIDLDLPHPQELMEAITRARRAGG